MRKKTSNGQATVGDEQPDRKTIRGTLRNLLRSASKDGGESRRTSDPLTPQNGGLQNTEFQKSSSLPEPIPSKKSPGRKRRHTIAGALLMGSLRGFGSGGGGRKGNTGQGQNGDAAAKIETSNKSNSSTTSLQQANDTPTRPIPKPRPPRSGSLPNSTTTRPTAQTAPIHSQSGPTNTSNGPIAITNPVRPESPTRSLPSTPPIAPPHRQSPVERNSSSLMGAPGRPMRPIGSQTQTVDGPGTSSPIRPVAMGPPSEGLAVQSLPELGGVQSGPTRKTRPVPPPRPASATTLGTGSKSFDSGPNTPVGPRKMAPTPPPYRTPPRARSSSCAQSPATVAGTSGQSKTPIYANMHATGAANQSGLANVSSMKAVGQLVGSSSAQEFPASQSQSPIYDNMHSMHTVLSAPTESTRMNVQVQDQSSSSTYVNVPAPTSGDQSNTSNHYVSVHSTARTTNVADESQHGNPFSSNHRSSPIVQSSNQTSPSPSRPTTTTRPPPPPPPVRTDTSHTPSPPTHTHTSSSHTPPGTQPAERVDVSTSFHPPPLTMSGTVNGTGDARRGYHPVHKAHRMCLVVQDFTDPTRPESLPLVRGGVVVVGAVGTQGEWWSGVDDWTGRVGVFPARCVVPLNERIPAVVVRPCDAPPSQPHHMSVEVCQLVTLLHTGQSDWFAGQHDTTGCIGLLPRACVVPLPQGPFPVDRQCTPTTSFFTPHASVWPGMHLSAGMRLGVVWMDGDTVCVVAASNSGPVVAMVPKHVLNVHGHVGVDGNMGGGGGQVEEKKSSGPESKARECLICMGGEEGPEFCVGACDHYVHVVCLVQMVRHGLGNASSFPLHCPHVGPPGRCATLLLPETAELLGMVAYAEGLDTLSGAELSTFSRRYAASVLGQQNHVTCPHPKCSAIIEAPEKDRTYKRSRCPQCTRPFCISCLVPWHEGQTCDAYQATHQPQLAATLRLIHATAKPCPRCNTLITHYRGHACHHIKPGGGCPGCGYHFCYNCLQAYPGCDCPRFCSETCACLPCPDCKPGKHCSSCDADGRCPV